LNFDVITKNFITAFKSRPFSVRKYRPQSDHLERSDLAKRFFIAGWERERAERAKREKERGQGLKYPSVGLSMI
jgi:hypothetical protein